jgi:DNA-binding transcriptional LysR family regulator
MNITLKQLRAFVAVAEAGSFTRAGDKLHLTQSATSGLIRELERELDIRLFHRTTRRVDLTEAGREFEARVDRLLASLDRSVADIGAIAARRRGRLAVAAPPLLAATMLPGIMAAFLERYPGIRVILRDVSTDQIVARVVDGDVDCGIGTFAAAAEGLVRTTLMSDALTLFVPADHPMDRHGPVRWRDIAAAPLIALTRDSGIRLLVDQSLATAGVTAEPAYEVIQITTAIAMVEAGLGVSVLPSYARLVGRRYRVATCAIDGPPVTRDIDLVQPTGRTPSPAATAFVEIAAQKCREPVPAMPQPADSTPTTIP